MQVLLKKTKPFYTNFNLFGAVSNAKPDKIVVDENHNSISQKNIIILLIKTETYFCHLYGF